MPVRSFGCSTIVGMDFPLSSQIDDFKLPLGVNECETVCVLWLNVCGKYSVT